MKKKEIEMLRKKACAVTLTLAFSSQLLIAPVAMAKTVDEAVKDITSNPTYTDFVNNQLKVDKSTADGFVRDMVKDLDMSKINDDSYIKGVVADKVISYDNDEFTNAIANLIQSQGYEAAKNTVKELGNLFRTGLTEKAPIGGGSSREKISKEEFKISSHGTTAEVNAGGKQYINITSKQMRELINGNKTLNMVFGDVNISFDKDSLNISQLLNQDNSHFRVEVKKVNLEKPMEVAQGGTLFRIAGNIYELAAYQLDDTDTVKEITAFKGTVNVSLPVPNGYKEAASLGNLMVYSYNEKTDKEELLGGTYDSTKNAVSFTTSHFSKYALLEKVTSQTNVPLAPVAHVKFSDIQGHWAASDIEYMASQGYVKGIGEGEFGPQRQVTRAEFVAMLVNVLGIKEEGTIAFKDVPKGSWYYSSVAIAYKAGLAKGKGADTFAPQAPITRQEMAVMICNALNYQGKQVRGDVSALSMFTDNMLIADWAKQSVANVLASKIVNGKPTIKGLSFAPQDYATRAEGTVMLRNILTK